MPAQRLNARAVATRIGDSMVVIKNRREKKDMPREEGCSR